MALTTSRPAVAQTRYPEWPPALKSEFAEQARHPNGRVGNELIRQTDTYVGWWLKLQPGERFGFHRHQLNYLWGCLTHCRARVHLMDGCTVERDYAAQESGQETFGPGEFKVRDLENIGTTGMWFHKVEFLEGLNQPLRIADRPRYGTGQETGWPSPWP